MAADDPRATPSKHSACQEWTTFRKSIWDCVLRQKRDVSASVELQFHEVSFWQAKSRTRVLRRYHGREQSPYLRGAVDYRSPPHPHLSDADYTWAREQVAAILD
jgi:hypothetical protein